VPSAPRESCLARYAGLQGRLFHGGTRSIEVFATQTLFVRESSFSATFSQPYRQTQFWIRFIDCRSGGVSAKALARIFNVPALMAGLKALP